MQARMGKGTVSSLSSSSSWISSQCHALTCRGLIICARIPGNMQGQSVSQSVSSSVVFVARARNTEREREGFSYA
ncbi:hypothetical protein M430DRAFT_36449 [Amorphotheca resinae ATCC 22711]|uniref:Uncharacterized protein n=1 Tax=Amorphotheca resinae ATCC 22711 TaxID=857342 RepID=A0A2T3AUA2_AMORE|nr:hypothetical protein M430DRAFT_36449 [Amorphotheca resinae ATCC 22711]PSS12259.1 hypothetical protein M430DRAFT_36449 [Amorphotheca resinae ATCC 22711]